MIVVVATEHRFESTPDGRVWTPTNYAYGFWKQYLEVFDGVRVVGRVRPVDQQPADWHRADGPKVTFAPMPYYIGPLQYIRAQTALRRAARAAVGDGDAVVIRVPSQISTLLLETLAGSDRPYGVEVLGNPRDVFARGAVRHPLRFYWRWMFTRALRRQCGSACAASYVTQQALQIDYPSHGLSVGVSDVEIDEVALVSQPRQPEAKSSWNLVTVMSLAQIYKGLDVLISALAACTAWGMDIHLAVVGDGKHRHEYEQLAAQRGVAGRIQFKGQLAAGQGVRAELDRADLFVLPSRTEGLPRALIEAMARGLPCIGTAVGGIPELLSPQDMVAPGDAAALAEKFREVLTDPQRLADMSARSLEIAQQYRRHVLAERRLKFYRHVRSQTEAWLSGRGVSVPSDPELISG